MRRVGEVQLGLLAAAASARRTRPGLRELGLDQYRSAFAPRRAWPCRASTAALPRRSPRLPLRVLHAAIARPGQVGVALVLLVGEDRVGLVDLDRRLGRIDHRLLGIELRPLAGDRGAAPQRHRPWPGRVRPRSRGRRSAPAPGRSSQAGYRRQHLAAGSRRPWGRSLCCRPSHRRHRSNLETAHGPVIPAIPDRWQAGRGQRRQSRLSGLAPFLAICGLHGGVGCRHRSCAVSGGCSGRP